MLQAEIRSGRDALHIAGETDGYNLQTMREFTRRAGCPGAAVHLKVHIDPDDAGTFARYTRRWLNDLAASGAVVEVVMGGH